ncbi:PAS-domain containing protein [Flavimaricola sp.]|nr:PAS domain-containing protein [Flavimaricola sp.]MDA9019610.1 PAS-domain containing protein [Flavimaricola sp.]
MPLIATLLNFGLCAATTVMLLRVWYLWKPEHLDVGPLVEPLSTEAAAVFLFDGHELVDANAAARHLLWHKDRLDPPWDRLMWLLSRQFSNFRDPLNGTLRSGRFSSQLAEDPSYLVVEIWDTMVRLTLHDLGANVPPIHPLALDAIEEEIQSLRRITEEAPQLMWIEAKNGEISWVNRAYLTLAEQVTSGSEGAAQNWPPVTLFPTLADDEPTPHLRRLSVQVSPETEPKWFDVSSHPHATETLHFAVDAGAVVAAESQGKLFVQTLTKTFANLSTGIAVFDRRRELVMFNPALMDLTGLAPGFLSSRPPIRAVLDQLRDLNMIPVPKDYASWRDQMVALEAAAESGNYRENWTLPGGQTYLVTGRPHPDGAVALMVEDISEDVSLKRRFRSKIETAQSVIDTIQDAIVVFSPTGRIVTKNASYLASWGDLTDSTSDARVADEVARWRSLTTPSPTWDRLIELVQGTAPRTPFQAKIPISGCSPIEVTASCLKGGMTMIRLCGTRVANQERDVYEAPDDEDGSKVRYA